MGGLSEGRRASCGRSIALPLGAGPPPRRRLRPERDRARTRAPDRRPPRRPPAERFSRYRGVVRQRRPPPVGGRQTDGLGPGRKRGAADRGGPGLQPVVRM